jgi:Tannase and feruloyl esterase
MAFQLSSFRNLFCWTPRGQGVICAMMAAALSIVTAFGADNTAKTSNCAAIAKLAKPGFVVEKAEIIPAGPAPAADGSGAVDHLGAPLPEHCLVQGMLNPRTGADGRKFGLGFDLRMPTKWNGRFAFQGGGGLDGRLAPALGDIFGSVRPPALARGFAVVGTDGGHRGSWLDGSFGLYQQARIDYAYNGLSDQGMASSVLADWYDQVLRDNGKSISESVRLFLVPGMTHCDGGQATDQFDMLEAIMAWVEEGRAPDRIKATGKAFPGASRPICPYPLVARYKSGDVNKAESFVCAK